MKISDMDTGDVAAIQGAMADLRAQVDALAVKSIDWRDESNMPPVPSRTERGTPYRSFSSGQAHDALATHAPFTGTLQELVEATLDAITSYRNSIGRPVDVVWRDGPLYEGYAPESGLGHSIWVRLAFEPAGGLGMDHLLPGLNSAATEGINAALNIALVEDMTPPDMEIVHKLEELLGRAMTGEIRGLATMYVTKGHEITTGWQSAPDASMHLIHSGVQILARRVSNDMIEGMKAP